MNDLHSKPYAHGHAHAGACAARMINVLIACEESQRECIEFRALGFRTFSCDIQKCSGRHPEWHVQGDVTQLLRDNVVFKTTDGTYHYVKHWHLIIAHPPCTYLCKVGSVRMWKDGCLVESRYRNMLAARAFFMQFFDAPCDYLAIENPIPMRLAGLPRPSCFADPSWFGEKYTKKTLYWTRNLPPLFAELEHPTPKEFVRASRGKYRSRTFRGLAEALAKQWGDYILMQLSHLPST